jgi:hypothetical protein
MSAASVSRTRELLTGAFNPYIFANVPKTVGTDFGSGRRDVDLYAEILKSAAKPDLTGLPDTPAEYDTSNSSVPTEGLLENLIRFRTATLPLDLAQQEQQARLTSRLTREQLASTYPYLSAAGAQATARNLGASKAFLATKEQMPGSVQENMASKQSQMASAAGAEAQRQYATADQTRAARDFGGIRFAGKYIQVA